MAVLEAALLERHTWKTRHELSLGIFGYTEGFSNRWRRHK